MVFPNDTKNFIEPEENYPKPKYDSLIEKYKIPVQHFEYSYIENCKDGKELERIVQILKSGEEGYFPDLTRFAENRLALIKPKSKLLRSACPVISKDSLSRDEKNELTNDLTQWINEVTKDDNELIYYKNRKSTGSLPQVRKTKTQICEEEKKQNIKRISATDYSSWDKYDPDTEILKMDLEEEKLKKNALEKKKPTSKKTVQFKDFMSDVEADREANYEKDKGNEFYKAGDFKEALRHYTNSINCKPTIASFNNRALVNIKLKKFQNALDDCNSALSIEPDNIKALLRKAQAFDGLSKHSEALETVERCIEIDPNNTLAQELAEKVRKSSGTIVKNSKRFVVQEIENNQKNVKKNISKKKQQVIIPIPGTSSMSPPHYITCSDSPTKIKEQTLKANTPNQILHLVSIENSDLEDDDCCTVNHLEKICSENKQKKYKENIKKLAELQEDDFKDSVAETNRLEKSKNESTQQVIKNDKNAGGEPYIKESEFDDIPDDIHSPYNFLKTWNSANIDKTLEQHATILRSIDMNRIVGVIGCKLDNSMFSTIIKCLCMHFAVPGEVDRLYIILENVVNLPRFDIISMLMSSEDRKSINILVNFLRQHGKPLSQDVVNKLLSI